jgi:hypothetical protein
VFTIERSREGPETTEVAASALNMRNGNTRALQYAIVTSQIEAWNGNLQDLVIL